jgi:retron-type reverse transcriptase
MNGLKLFKTWGIQRREYSTIVNKDWSESDKVIKESEKYLLELGSILTPILLDMFGKDNGNIWPLTKNNQEGTLIISAISTYIKLYTYLIAIETSRTFKLTFKTEMSIYYAITDNNDIEALKYMKKGYRKYEKLLKYINTIYQKERKRKTVEIKGYNYNEFNRNLTMPIPSVDRKLIKDKDKWKPILDKAGTNMNSIIFHVWAVLMIEESHGRFTAGADKKAFKVVPKKFTIKSRKTALTYLTPRIEDVRKILSIAKGKTDQVIKRKGISNLNYRDRLRRILKSEESKKGIMRLREDLKNILSDPIEYVKNLIKDNQYHNDKIKRKLLYSLKPSKIRNYKPDSCLRVYIPKSNDKLRSVGIPSLKDRTMQMLMKLIMEPYLEPLGDTCSFGFRPGKNAHQATAYLHNALLYRSYNNNELSLMNMRKLRGLSLKYNTYLSRKYDKKSMTRTEIAKEDGGEFEIKIPSSSGKAKRIIVSKNFIESLELSRKPAILKTQYIWDADIKSCFEKISHEWLTQNLPMPSKFEYLLPLILKPRIVERKYRYPNNPLISNRIKPFLPNINQTIIEEITKEGELKEGIPQGGIISPIIMNWTLDGLEETAKLAADSVTNTSVDLNSNRKHIVDLEHKKMLEEYDNNLKEQGLPNIKKYPSDLNKVATIAGYRNTWVIRYADDFIVSAKHELHLKEAIKSINDFLKERGLEISKKKTKTIKWKMGAKFDFLGWTHKLIVPRRSFWLIKKDKRIRGALADWKGNYAYPSRKSTKNFRDMIVALTNIKQIKRKERDVIIDMNAVIRVWINYFTPCPHLLNLFRNLDMFILNRFKRFIYKKYGAKSFKYYLRYFSDQTYEDWLKTKKLKFKYPSIVSQGENSRNKVLSLKIPTQLYNRAVIWGPSVPILDILRNSFFTHPKAFIDRAIYISNTREDKTL